MLRLVAYAPDGVRRFPVHRSELVIGSRPECDIYLPYTGVAQQHARLSYDGSELRIEDLGSRRGLVVSGRKVRETALEVLDEIRVGGVTLLVEDVLPERDKGAPRQAPPKPEVCCITPERMVAHLARVSEWVLTDTESRTTSEALVTEVLADFGGGALFLLVGDLEQPGVKLVVATEQRWMATGEDLLDQLRAAAPTTALTEGVAFDGRLGDEPAWICAHAFTAVERTYLLLTAFPRFAPAEWSPLPALRTLGNLVILGLVHHVGWYEPILPGHQGQQDLTLAPGLVIGESQAMKRVVEELRSAVDPPVHVLLRGEAGVGRELLARSLHVSGPRRHGPFIVASCSGVQPVRLEAELFGSEVPGKGEPMRREGKLLLADRGTLFLGDVEQLPLDIQARLVRFLRSGEVEPVDSREVLKVDVRIIAASRVPLEDVVARDEFRVDLAYRLSRLTIDVPPLRERREDLPLLIQSYINKFCHETGNRMQGITVKAMSALLSYDYPGNLEELSNIARQLVYLCPPGRPVDINLLPERVRRGTLQSAARVDAASDLALDRLVATCEQAAIREALRRTHGNKSQAAKILGLSRNGLAIKMERHGVKG